MELPWYNRTVQQFKRTFLERFSDRRFLSLLWKTGKTKLYISDSKILFPLWDFLEMIKINMRKPSSVVLRGAQENERNNNNESEIFKSLIDFDQNI